jgi:hypothetical protein
MDLTQYLLVVLVAVVMGWFGLGVVYNLRRGNAVLKWMQSGLPLLGEKTTLRWLGSSAVQLGIARAKPPFRRAEIVLVLAPRDVPWLWLGSALRGRRDLLIFRGQLQAAPRLEYDVLQPESWTGRPALSQALSAGWGEQELGEHTFLAPQASLPVSLPAAQELLQAARAVHPAVWRFSVRRDWPQLELHIPLPDPKQCAAPEYFAALRSIAQQMADLSK